MFSGIRDTASAVMGAIAGAAVAVALCVLFYEGLPLGPLRHIPVVGPVLEEVADGRVDRERRKAREGYVVEARAIAAEAKAAELARQLEAGRKATDGFAELLAESQAREASAADELEKRISDYEVQLAAAGRSCLLDSHDLDWLRE